MPRKNFDKIIDRGPSSDQYRVAHNLNLSTYNYNYAWSLSTGDPVKIFNDYCENASITINCFVVDLDTENESIDDLLNRRRDTKLFPEMVNSITHATECERCSFALMELLSHIDENGKYKE